LQTFNQEPYVYSHTSMHCTAFFKRLLTFDMACVSGYIKLRGAFTYTGNHYWESNWDSLGRLTASPSSATEFAPHQISTTCSMLLF